MFGRLGFVELFIIAVVFVTFFVLLRFIRK